MYDAHRLRSPDDDRGRADRSIEVTRPEALRQLHDAHRHVHRRVPRDSLAFLVTLARPRALRRPARAAALSTALREQLHLHDSILLEFADIDNCHLRQVF
ncbi:MAG TPA: hypothetical protein VGM88_26705, partial [Kofleriaceae bacterium]